MSKRLGPSVAYYRPCPGCPPPLAQVLGPRLTWRITQHPIFGAWNLGNAIVANLAVWGQLAAWSLLAAAAAHVRAQARARAAAAAKRKVD